MKSIESRSRVGKGLLELVARGSRTHPPAGFSCLAETIRGSASRSLADAQEYETSRSGLAFTRPAAAIGVKALLSGKKPDFRRVV